MVQRWITGSQASTPRLNLSIHPHQDDHLLALFEDAKRLRLKLAHRL
jgi:hypothetical protein